VTEIRASAASRCLDRRHIVTEAATCHRCTRDGERAAEENDAVRRPAAARQLDPGDRAVLGRGDERHLAAGGTKLTKVVDEKGLNLEPEDLTEREDSR
jgi:hypothetical protein